MKDSERQQHQVEPEMQQDPPVTERGLGGYNLGGSSPMSPEISSDKDQRQPLSIPTGPWRFFAMEYWQQYFRISQEEVWLRIVQSVKPLKPEFLRISQSNPDLYGPFWIMTTIIVLVSLSGNLARFFRHWEEAKFEFRLELVRYALVVVYGYGLIYPTLLGILLRFFGSKLSPIVVLILLIQIVCLYGYSLSTFLGICICCIVPSPVLHWLLILYGTLNSTALILANLQVEAAKLQQRNSYIFYSTVGFGQLLFMLVFKSTFYDLNYKA